MWIYCKNIGKSVFGYIANLFPHKLITINKVLTERHIGTRNEHKIVGYKNLTQRGGHYSKHRRMGFGTVKFYFFAFLTSRATLLGNYISLFRLLNNSHNHHHYKVKF